MHEFSQIFLKKLEIGLYPEFLSSETCMFGPQICKLGLGTQTCILCPTIATTLQSNP